MGLFDHPFGDDSQFAAVGSEEHRQLAREAVRKLLVLLKNEDEILPLAKNISSIFIAGQAAEDIGVQCGGWTIEWQGKSGAIQSGTTVLEGIRQIAAEGTDIQYDPAGAFEGMAEVGIAVVGEQPYAEGVGDKSDLSLSSADIQTITNLRAHVQKMVVILISGRPLVITPQVPLAEAWVAAWLPGSEGAGIADVLFGDASFVGTLPYTWPRSNEQLPINLHNAGPAGDCSGPLYPLGYGLGEADSQPIPWLDCE
jgi:beta-glucosidase